MALMPLQILSVGWESFLCPILNYPYRLKVTLEK